MLSGQGTLTIDVFDTDAKLVRGTFSFTGEMVGGSRREITSGAFETDQLNLR